MKDTVRTKANSYIEPRVTKPHLVKATRAKAVKENLAHLKAMSDPDTMWHSKPRAGGVCSCAGGVKR